MPNRHVSAWHAGWKTKLNRPPEIDNTESKIELGWREWVGLPQLGIFSIKAKVDTGTRTSALHAFEVEEFEFDEKNFIRFKVHPRQKDDELVVECVSEVIEKRIIRDSSGKKEARWVIETEIHIGDEVWVSEITLTAHKNMMFRMSLGRTAFSGKAIVDPSMSFNQGRRIKKL